MVGNLPNFTKLEILKCFLRFRRKISRNELSRELGIGEGTTRTILNLLKEKGLLDSSKKGHFLSRKGKDMLDVIENEIEGPQKIKATKLFPDFKVNVILLKKNSEIRNTCKLRDLAVKEKAEGALILSYNGKLYTPESEHNKDFDDFESIFKLKNGDIIIISFAEREKHAESGCLAVASELNEELKSFLNQF